MSAMKQGLRAAGYKRLAALGLLLGAGLLVHVASAKDDFLPPEQAYRYATRVEGDRLIVAWDIERGYYLYKKKMAVLSETSTVQLGEPDWPKGEDHTDEYFGTQEIYRGKVEVPVPLRIAGARPEKLALELRLQGCADAGLCYPPQKWKTQVPLSSAAGGARQGNALSKLFGAQSKQDEFLPPDAAFRFGAGMERPDAVALTWLIADGYYLYKHRIQVRNSARRPCRRLDWHA
jgi:thioredoxin:protein disulfide reductase